MDVAFQIAAKGMKNSCHGGEESLLFAEGDDRLRAGGKDSVQEFPLLKKQCSKLRRNRKSGMKIGAIREKMIDVCHPLVALNFSANRAKAAFARARNPTYFPRVIGAGKGGEAKAIGFPATHDLPNVVGHVPGDQCFVDSKEGTPVFLEYLFKRE